MRLIPQKRETQCSLKRGYRNIKSQNKKSDTSKDVPVFDISLSDYLRKKKPIAGVDPVNYKRQ